MAVLMVESLASWLPLVIWLVLLLTFVLGALEGMGHQNKYVRPHHRHCQTSVSQGAHTASVYLARDAPRLSGGAACYLERPQRQVRAIITKLNFTKLNFYEVFHKIEV